MTRTTNLAALAGRWSARHRRAAILGWLAFVIAAVAVGAALGTNSLGLDDGAGESARAEATLARAFPDAADEAVLVQAGGAGPKWDDPAFEAAVRAHGGAGRDDLIGGAADDLLRGGKGSDVLLDDIGDDTLNGAPVEISQTMKRPSTGRDVAAPPATSALTSCLSERGGFWRRPSSYALSSESRGPPSRRHQP